MFFCKHLSKQDSWISDTLHKWCLKAATHRSHGVFHSEGVRAEGVAREGVDKRTMAIVWITQISYGPVQKPAEPQCCKQRHVQSLIWNVAWPHGGKYGETVRAVMKGGWHFIIMCRFRINILRHILLSFVSARITHTFLAPELLSQVAFLYSYSSGNLFLHEAHLTEKESRSGSKRSCSWAKNLFPFYSLHFPSYASRHNAYPTTNTQTNNKMLPVLEQTWKGYYVSQNEANCRKQWCYPLPVYFKYYRSFSIGNNSRCPQTK